MEKEELTIEDLRKAKEALSQPIPTSDRMIYDRDYDDVVSLEEFYKRRGI